MNVIRENWGFLVIGAAGGFYWALIGFAMTCTRCHGPWTFTNEDLNGARESRVMSASAMTRPPEVRARNAAHRRAGPQPWDTFEWQDHELNHRDFWLWLEREHGLLLTRRMFDRFVAWQSSEGDRFVDAEIVAVFDTGDFYPPSKRPGRSIVDAWLEAIDRDYEAEWQAENVAAVRELDAMLVDLQELKRATLLVKFGMQLTGLRNARAS